MTLAGSRRGGLPWRRGLASGQNALMRYRLRTLLILLGVGPPLVAIAVWSFQYERFPGIPLSLAVFSIAVLVRARDVGRNPVLWTMLTWILGFAGGICAVTVVYVALRFISVDVLLRLSPKAVAVCSALSGAFVGASVALFGAGRPIQKLRPT
jgi:hypothetical protein